ncbi:hypothetical protein COCHEDRAFT_1021826 [Bipolaris maydis C5]|uniref:Uncharacterized protein n=1 Tax=Cochliobolus heterostrophus (strain C5 / ATCC 48332 / race O) TaxID=701091 RepID=M2UT93_COCH5|nr:hypothetical protein COCHEDRAFT_1021826 [Bipolaris maydis C5]
MRTFNAHHVTDRPQSILVLCIKGVGVSHVLTISGTMEERGPLQIRKSRGLVGSILNSHLSMIDFA